MRKPPYKMMLVQLRPEACREEAITFDGGVLTLTTRAVGITDCYADLGGNTVIIYDEIEKGMTKVARVIPWKDIKYILVELNA